MSQELKKDRIEKFAVSLSTNRLKLTIMPTEKCNFRCFYCYGDYEHGAMLEETVAAIKKLLNHRVINLKMLNIEWFGGEPTLAEPIVVDISNHIQDLLRTYPNIIYTAAMTTNGYLLDEKLLTKFCSLNIKHYQISLDGTPENHNQTRRLANGSVTFDKIWNNLLAAKATNLDFSIILRIHFFLDNYTEIVPLVQEINDTFLIDKRFKIYFKAIQHLGGKNDTNIKSILPEDEIKIKNYLKQFVTEKQQVFDVDLSKFACYASETNAMVIRANGDISKCTVALNEPYNKVGKINSDGTLSIDSKKFLAWSKGFKNWEIKDLNCPNLYMMKEYQGLLNT